MNFIIKYLFKILSWDPTRTTIIPGVYITGQPPYARVEDYGFNSYFLNHWVHTDDLDRSIVYGRDPLCAYLWVLLIWVEQNKEQFSFINPRFSTELISMEDLHEFADTIDPPVYLTSIVMTLLCMTPRDREVDLIYINYRWCVCPQHALTIIKGGMHYILAQQILEFLENTGFYIRVSKDVFDSHATMIDQSVSQNQSKINLIKPESLLVTLSFLVNCFKASGLVEKTIVRNHHTQDEIPYIQELLKFNSDFSNILSEPRTV